MTTAGENTKSLGHSVIVKLLGRRGTDVVKARPAVRVFTYAKQQVAAWMKEHLLKVVYDGWLLNIALRLEAIRNGTAGCCMICCGGGHDIVVVFNDATIPQDCSSIPRIQVTIAVAIEKGGAVQENPMEVYGAISPQECVWDIVNGALNSGSGYVLGDCCVVVNTETEFYGNKLIQGTVEDKRLLRLSCDPGTWNCTNVRHETISPELFARLQAGRGDAVAAALVAAMPRPATKESTVVRTTPAKVEQERLQHSDKKQDATPRKKRADGWSCYYAPYCMKPSTVCGGRRAGLCKEVNSNRVQIPEDNAVFLAAKKKHKGEIDKKRRAEKKQQATTEREVPASSPKKKEKRKGIEKKSPATTDRAAAAARKGGDVSSSSESTVTADGSGSPPTPLTNAPFFSAREYLVLSRAFEGKLTKKDMKESGGKSTKKDVNKVAKLFMSIEAKGVGRDEQEAAAAPEEFGSPAASAVPVDDEAEVLKPAAKKSDNIKKTAPSEASSLTSKGEKKAKKKDKTIKNLQQGTGDDTNKKSAPDSVDEGEPFKTSAGIQEDTAKKKDKKASKKAKKDAGDKKRKAGDAGSDSPEAKSSSKKRKKSESDNGGVTTPKKGSPGRSQTKKSDGENADESVASPKRSPGRPIKTSDQSSPGRPETKSSSKRGRGRPKGSKNKKSSGTEKSQSFPV